MINKSKRSFRAMRPEKVMVKSSETGKSKECHDITLEFRVHDEFVKYALNDQDDECFPYIVEGKWHLEMTKDELLEGLVEQAL